MNPLKKIKKKLLKNHKSDGFVTLLYDGTKEEDLPAQEFADAGAMSSSDWKYLQETYDRYETDTNIKVLYKPKWKPSKCFRK